MENLNKILGLIKSKKDKFRDGYFIPEAWKPDGFGLYKKYDGRKGEIAVNPYIFIEWCIEKEILAHAGKTENLNDTAVNPAEKAIYGILPRVFTAWDHYEKGRICYGTFVKSICLLPYLKSMGVDIVYLLPVFKTGEKYKKGDTGSPYAIKNIYELDKKLHDELLGEFSEKLLETEFKAFIEACHILGFSVLLDFAFRTVSRDSDLISEHPDWFYWIDLKHAEKFSVPVVEKTKMPLPVNEETVVFLYESKNLDEYLSKFTWSPDKIDKRKWEKLVRLHKETGSNILELIENEFGITTVPGFSDVINDNQPIWSDVTYLRFYFDNHAIAKEYVKDTMPPYIMQDGVCLKLNRGGKENAALIKYITDVIPYYRDNFGIDGARIDMGHALSAELNREINAKAKSGVRFFILWSEELIPKRAESAYEDGFHFISGNLWSVYKSFDKPGFNKILLDDTLMNAAIPMTAALETPDTPRAALVHRNADRLRQLVMINCFMPNTVPYINNGQELVEIQPMNLGLDNTNEGRFVLDKDDPMYGKLAFFDNYRFHWTGEGGFRMKELIADALIIRKEFSGIISKKEKFIINEEVLENDKLLCLCCYDKSLEKGVFVIANKGLKTRAEVILSLIYKEYSFVKTGKFRLIYSNWKRSSRTINPGEKIILDAGGVIIGSIGI
ncbi:MAG TPA: alpha amylase [Ruminiclostridium sp.]|jgi:glycosidase|nr:alpha amylase [Clostridiaceae bacterium]HAA25822.1 alpha amylase [Ruminiclostridium sp.]